MPCTEKTSFSRLCCCRETLGTLNRKNICFSSRHYSPFSLAGRGEGCHYFPDESGKSSVFTVLNVSNVIIAGLNLEFGNIGKLLGLGKKRKKIVITYVPRYNNLCSQICRGPRNHSSLQILQPPGPTLFKVFLGLIASTWH